MSVNTVDILQKIRQNTFSDYNKITLDRESLRLLSYLFLNPDCQSDIDLFSLPGENIRLFDLGQHIITAAPATLAKYAQQKKLLHLNKMDILQCFAVEHAVDIHNNKIDLKNNPYYALAHLLNYSRVKKIVFFSKKKFAWLESTLPWGKIIFKKVIIPETLDVDINDFVFHHFGVVVDRDNKKNKLANIIYQKQINNTYIVDWIKQTIVKNIVIDFSDQSIFQQNVVDNILHPQQVKPIINPQDIEMGKIKFQK